MGFEPHSVRRFGPEACLPAPTEGVNPLVRSPRRGLTPFETPCRGFKSGEHFA
jgi:hypothetical protein